MQKQKSTKKSGGHKKSATRKRVKVTRKKEAGAKSGKSDNSVLTKLKEVLDDATARIKTLLPGDKRGNNAKPVLHG
jgi:hypothetical protein